MPRPSLVAVNYYLFFINVVLLCDRYPSGWIAIGGGALAFVAYHIVRDVYRNYTREDMMDVLLYCAIFAGFACVVVIMAVNIGWIICYFEPENPNPNACNWAPLAYPVNRGALIALAAPLAMWIAK